MRRASRATRHSVRWRASFCSSFRAWSRSRSSRLTSTLPPRRSGSSSVATSACRRSRSTSASRTLPSAAPSHLSSSRNVRTVSWLSSGRNVRRLDRRRRVATRAWCTASGSSPRRTPGSCSTRRVKLTATAAATTVASDDRLLRGGTARSGGSHAAGPRARITFGCGGAGRAPAARSLSTTRASSPTGAPSTTSTSSSRNRSTAWPPATTVTSSSSISTHGCASPSRSSIVRRRVTKEATGTSGAERARARTRSATGSGTPPPTHSPGKVISRRARWPVA